MLLFLEYFGAALAAIGFYSLSTGELLAGFIIGLVSCAALLAVFFTQKNWGLFALQTFFTFANINGILTFAQ